MTEHLSFGGAEVVLTEYLRNIDKSRYKVSLVMRDDLGEKNYLLDRVPQDVVVKTVFSAKKLARHKLLLAKSFSDKIQNHQKKMLYKRDLVQGFRDALKELKPDIVIDFAPVLNRFMDDFKDYKMILWMHGQKSHMPRWERYKYFLRMRKYDKIVLICEEMREQFIQFFPSVQDKFVVIYNPFDFERIKAMANDESELTEQDRELMNREYFVSIGRLVPGKDFKTIIAAGKILKERGIEFTHYILGSGELLQPLQEQINKSSLQKNVFLLGPKKNPFTWLKKSQMFVHSALREGLPTVIIESMILEKPVIACTCPTGPREILEDGQAGALYPVGDAKALADNMQRVLEDKTLRGKYLDRAQGRVQVFSKSHVMPQFYNLMESLLK